MHLSRRRALTCGLALAGAAGTTGCRASTRARSEQATGPTGVDEAAADLDDALLSRVRAAFEARLLAITGAGSRYPALVGPLEPLAQMHLAHRAVLDPEAADRGSVDRKSVV